LNIGIGELRSGIFNIADMAIMAGLFLILPMAFKSSAPKKEENPANDADEDILLPEIEPEPPVTEAEKEDKERAE